MELKTNGEDGPEQLVLETCRLKFETRFPF